MSLKIAQCFILLGIASISYAHNLLYQPKSDAPKPCCTPDKAFEVTLSYFGARMKAGNADAITVKYSAHKLKIRNVKHSFTCLIICMHSSEHCLSVPMFHHSIWQMSSGNRFRSTNQMGDFQAEDLKMGL